MVNFLMENAKLLLFIMGLFCFIVTVMGFIVNAVYVYGKTKKEIKFSRKYVSKTLIIFLLIGAVITTAIFEPLGIAFGLYNGGRLLPGLMVVCMFVIFHSIFRGLILRDKESNLSDDNIPIPWNFKLITSSIVALIPTLYLFYLSFTA